ncbi:hypothetical protein F5Y01DRAFT_307719 [Xylaria sp. FL0043]|nr:hypothetical protein F5Y01DRAFT_307719 [Xylaria sp. FL0043]
MCNIICNVTYRCGHVEPWVKPRECQFDAQGNRKWGEKDPLCLIPGHCWAFGSVRKINIVDDKFQCSLCFICKTEDRKDITDEQREKMVSSAARNAFFHSRSAENHINEAERRSILEEIAVSRINKATNIALRRLDFAFADAQMRPWHFEELLQIVMGLPFLDKPKLVGKFASKAEKKFDTKHVRRFYEVSMTGRNFGESFRAGLKKPGVLDDKH